MSRFTDKVQINIPLTMLYESFLDRFIMEGLNPEIGVDADALDRYQSSDLEVIAERLFEKGLSVTLHGPFMDLSPGSPDREVVSVTRMRLEQMLELVHVFRPKTVVCHTGYDEKRYWHMKDAWVEKSLEIWSWVGTMVRNEGSLLMLENVYEKGPDDMLILFENLESQGVGFCLDTGHHSVFSNVPVGVWLDTLGRYLGQLHLHDNMGGKDEHLALGRGKIDFRMLFSRLKEDRKSPPVIITLEPHTEEDLLPSLEYLEKIWPW